MGQEVKTEGENMARINYKDSELINMAKILLSAEDYSKRMQALNGIRMGLSNKYKYSIDDIDKTTKGRRLKLWKQLVDEYK